MNNILTDWEIGIRKEVMEDNVYRVPPIFQKNDLVLDIGAHIGFFSLMCLQRGATVIAVEPYLPNFKRLSFNTFPFIQKTLHNAAAWRSDVICNSLLFKENKENSGGGNCFSLDGLLKIPIITFDSLINDKVKLLKLDCEGSEFPIIYTSNKLDQIASISMEVHPVNLPESCGVSNKIANPKSLGNYLKKKGFSVELIEKDSKGWAFIYANRI